MMDGVLGDQDVSDIQISISGACHTGINEMGYLEYIYQDLYAQGSVYLTDTGADHYYVGAV